MNVSNVHSIGPDGTNSTLCVPLREISVYIQQTCHVTFNGTGEAGQDTCTKVIDMLSIQSIIVTKPIMPPLLIACYHHGHN